MRGLYAYNSSAVNISGGSLDYLYAYNSSAVNISGGSVHDLYAYDSSTADVSGVSVYSLYAYGSSTVSVTGGSVSTLRAYNTSAVEVSGGTVGYLYVYNNGTVTLHGYDFRATAGLMLYGGRVLGTGILSGEWFDGTPWTVNISQNADGAIIRVVPEPATLSLLSLGGLAVLRRKKVVAF